jgi:hypothetical protein
MANMDRVVAAAEATSPRPAGFYAAYYDTLNFQFDERARAGLRRYVSELYALGAIPARALVEAEDLRLNEPRALVTPSAAREARS